MPTINVLLISFEIAAESTIIKEYSPFEEFIFIFYLIRLATGNLNALKGLKVIERSCYYVMKKTKKLTAEIFNFLVSVSLTAPF